MTTVTCSNRVVKLSTASRSVRLLARAIGLGEAIRVDARFLMAAMTFTGVSLELMRISDQPLDVLHQVLPIQDDRQDVEMAVIACNITELSVGSQPFLGSEISRALRQIE
jgi:hypothetical protein